MDFRFLAVVSLAVFFYSCDDTTTGIGGFVSDVDKIDAFSKKYEASSNTVRLEKVYSRTNRAYLGRYTDPDFGLYTADFITQVNCPENFEFPKTIKNIKETTLELYYPDFYGDSLANMTLQVDLLDKAIGDSEDDEDLYYTNYDPNKYLGDIPKTIATKTYTATDLSVSDSLRNSSDYYPHVIVDLDKNKPMDGKSMSDYIFAKYNDNKENFKDAYSFIHNVLKGFYVHVKNGEGSVIYIQDIWLRMKIEFDIKGSQGQDSTVYGNVNFAATKEVFMSTRMKNDGKLDNLVRDGSCTYLKTPAGLCTEVTLPIDDIYKVYSENKDNKDSIAVNSVNLSLKKYRYAGKDENIDKSPYKMGIPSTLLMVRKSEYEDFFLNNKTFDNKTSFIGTYDAKTNSYTFSKLNRLITGIITEINQDKEVENRDVVMLIPVTTSTDAEGKIIGISHDMEVNAARLFGGTDGDKLEVEVVYTRPK